ncbi:MAG: bifunctional glutamate N-acetyltransferase/amino-acid acetyltransferase ArgJ [Alphaproteobacteria bacterium]|nr:bifunctional glutamate N-acetyltransferase/amino-acid acetyltransferase ArgJ [Alphaproteobacteria bacterium]
MTPSPLAPDRFPDLPPVAGVRLAAGACGLKRNGARDLMLATLEPGTTMAGLLTRSQCPSAPVEWCRSILPHGMGRAIVVNSGNANAFTGNAGDETVRETVIAAAQLLGCRREAVYVASTGVIGQTVAANHIGRSLPGLMDALAPDAWEPAADAIRTTDTFPKGAVRTARIGETTVTLCGIAKGSGMIAPDMATMLAFVFTDAHLPADVLRGALRPAADRSLNCVTVDGDTSTSDTLLLAATGRAAHPPVADHRDRALNDFRRALEAVMVDLAQQIARDGEGAQKLITITVTGAASRRAARRVGLTIGNSPLVKTAIAGADANWGRIVMAVGRSGERADRDRLSIAIGGVDITREGRIVPGYDEAPVAAHMQGREIAIAVDLGIGRGRATVWTCDLTHGYIGINADYRS